jgi:shikimate kinase
VLVGIMGAGKSTVGRRVARRLGWGFLDLDAWIEERLGRSIAEVFRERGEPAFREEERRAAEDAARLLDHVIAAGGGAFESAGTREALRKDAISVWLRLPFAVTAGRVPADGSRPLAANRERMQRLFQEREAGYTLADHAVDAAAEPEIVAERVIEAVFGRSAPRRAAE